MLFRKIQQDESVRGWGEAEGGFSVKAGAGWERHLKKQKELSEGRLCQDRSSSRTCSVYEPEAGRVGWRNSR